MSAVPPQFSLRPVTAADLPFLEDLRRTTMRRVVENHRSWNNAEQRKRILQHLDCARIIVRDGRDIGLWKVVWGTTEIELCQIQIDPAHQGNGLGTRLIQELQEKAGRSGLPITLHVYRSNPALTLYRRLGFQIASEDAESLRMVYQAPHKVSRIFPSSLHVPLRNHLTGRPYALVRADDVAPTREIVAQITGICREKKVYDWLFREMLEGRSYEESNAREFLEWAHAGWASGSHFVFFALDEWRNIGAACDIKSADPVAEIGYWAGGQHRGIMTNAVKAMAGLAAEAGFRGVFARTAPGNRESQAVLERSGFKRLKDRPNGDARFELPLRPESSSPRNSVV